MAPGRPKTLESKPFVDSPTGKPPCQIDGGFFLPKAGDVTAHPLLSPAKRAEVSLFRGLGPFGAVEMDLTRGE
jgi:hypothetical protein